MRGRRLLAALIAALLLGGCSKVTTTAAGGANPWTHPGKLVFSTAADTKTLDPVLSSAQPALEISMFLYSWAIRYDEHNKPYPEALERIPTVENGDVSKDGLTLRYHIRHGMKWHDGVGEITCKDLEFTRQVVLNPANNDITQDGYRDIKSIDCSDPYVAVVHMKHVYAPFLQNLWAPNGNAPILPEHVLAKYNDAKGSFNTAPFQSAPIGSGPFKFAEWQRGSFVRMTAFEQYGLGKPGLDEATYKILPDTNTLVAQLRSHEVDLGFNLPAGQWDVLKSIPGTEALDQTVYVYDHIDFNLKRPLFADVRVRQALDYALDKAELLAKIRHGLGELTSTFQCASLYPDSYDPSVPQYAFDLAKAKALLDAAGWTLGADGVRHKGGQRLSFTISTQTESITGQAIEVQAQSAWKALGAEAIVKNVPSATFFDNTANGTLQGGHYDTAAFAWSGTPDVDQAPIYSGHNLAPHGQNALFWNDAEATRLMDDANGTVDQARRIADYKRVQRIFAEQVPSIILWFRKGPVVYNKDLTGMKSTAALTQPFSNVWEYKI